jgi:hypothetical protein
MPVYEVTDSRTGRVLELTGDRPPTDEELQEIFAQYSAPQETQSGMSKAARTAIDVGVEAGSGIAGSTVGGLIGAALAPATLGASIPIGAIIGGAIGGGVGNVAVQRGQINRGERPDFSYGELAAGVGLSAIPAGTFFKTGNSVLKTMAARSAQGAGLGGAAEIAKTAIDENRLPTANEFLTATVFGAATGGALGGVEAGVTKAIKTTPEATLGKLVPLIKRIEGERSGLATEGEFAISSLKTSIEGVKDKVQRDALSGEVVKYLRGQSNIANLPENVAEKAKSVRDIIDDFSARLKANGMIDPGTELYNTLTNNTGSYVRNAYRIFNSDWKPDDAVFQKFVNQSVEEEIQEKLNRKIMFRESKLPRGGIGDDAISKLEKETRSTWETKLRQKYTNLANNLLDRDNAFEFLTGGKSNIDRSIFKRRKNLDPLTKELLGEINDPIFVASDTLGRMTKTEATYNVMKQVADLGRSNGMFRDSSKMGDVLLTKDSSNMNPLRGIYTTPEIRDAFNDITTNRVGAFAQKFGAIASLSSALKLPKTLGSLKGYASNLWGGMMDTVAQGHFGEFFETNNWKRAARVAGYNLGVTRPDGSLDSKEAMQLFKGMRTEGLIAPNIQFNDFMRSFEMGEKTLAKALPQEFIGKSKKGLELAGKVYSLPETTSKIFNLAGEMRTLTRAMPGASRQEIFKMAAQRVRQTTQDYDSLPRFLKDFSGIGILDPFVAYSADRFRVVFNTYKLALADLASDNPVLRTAGAKRLAAMTTVLGSAGYLASNTNLSPEEEKALRNRMPDWDKQGFVSISPLKDDGTFTYTNLNYNLPHSSAIEAMQAAMRGQSPEEAFTNFMTSLGNQAFGANLLLAPVSQLVTGKNRYGLPISSENASLYKQVLDKSNYFIDGSVTPLAVSEMNKLYRAYQNKGEKIVTPSGDTYGVDEILKENFAGIRNKTIRVGDRMRLNAAVIRRNLSDDLMAYSSQKRRALTDEDKQSAYAQFEDRYRNTYKRATDLVTDSRALGMDEDQIIEIMRNGGIPSSIMLGAVSGIYVPPVDEEKNPTRAIYEGIEKLSENQRAAAVEKAARENPTISRNLINRYRQDLRNKALNISEVDKLLLSQDEADGDRARFIFQKMQTLPDDLMRTAYLEDLRKKRVITPVVNAQLNLLMNPPR